jgi:hypothetical protein
MDITWPKLDLLTPFYLVQTWLSNMKDCLGKWVKEK